MRNYIRHVLLFCCLVVLPFLSVKNSYATCIVTPVECQHVYLSMGACPSSVNAGGACSTTGLSQIVIKDNGGTDHIITAGVIGPGPINGASSSGSNSRTIDGINIDITATMTCSTWPGNSVGSVTGSYTSSVGLSICGTPIAGTCGTSDGGAFPSAPTTNLCGAGDGVATPAPSGAGPWAWTCGGSGGGAPSPTCNATQGITGVCGSASGDTFVLPPVENLCGAGDGIATPTPFGSGPWAWTCGGSGGGAPSPACSATRAGACGAAHNVPTLSTPTTKLCGDDTMPAVTLIGTDYTWVCIGAGGDTSSCKAPKIINGACGTANGTGTSTTPAIGLCAVGTASAVTGFAPGPWSWDCTGLNTGAPADCKAPPPPPPPTFGGACP